MPYKYYLPRRRRTARNDRRTAPARRRDRRDGRDASGGWRDEYRIQDAALPDGGSRYLLPDRGARVRDLDDDGEDPDELIVVAVHSSTPAREYYLEGLECTVAAVNRCYDPDAPVVDAVYVEAVEEFLEASNGTVPLAAAVETGRVTAYSFPADRLELAGDRGGDPA